MSEAIDETTGGEAPVLHPAGGEDKAQEAARAAQGDVIQAEPGQGEEKAPETENVPPAPESTATGDSTASGEESRPLTPEEQAEIDAMVDFTVTEETLGELNANLPADKEPLKVGDVVKLAKDHPILTRGGGEGSV
jgi:hypothetical protein